MFRVHVVDPTAAVEQAYFRIYRERMADVPVHNDALSVEAVDFQGWQGHWLGVVVTPWHMSVLLLPGQRQGWVSVAEAERRFIKFPAGDFAFLGGNETELGEFQSCPLFSPMDKFATQSDAVLAARAALAAMLQAPAQPAQASSAAASEKKPSLSRRRFMGLR